MVTPATPICAFCEGRAWAEARIKQMTGGDTITARFMRQDNFSFMPQFKLTIVGNHRPVLRNVDEAAPASLQHRAVPAEARESG
jgi:hypothetical protein